MSLDWWSFLLRNYSLMCDFLLQFAGSLTLWYFSSCRTKRSGCLHLPHSCLWIWESAEAAGFSCLAILNWKFGHHMCLLWCGWLRVVFLQNLCYCSSKIDVVIYPLSSFSSPSMYFYWKCEVGCARSWFWSSPWMETTPFNEMQQPQVRSCPKTDESQLFNSTKNYS